MSLRDGPEINSKAWPKRESRDSMKVLVLGHGRHGKDCFTEMFAKAARLRFNSSSQTCCDEFIFDELKGKYGYETPEQCFEDRHNHRIEWRDMIRDYNTPDKSRLSKLILAHNDIYVGMRCDLEYQASKHLYDLILWVDASDRLDIRDTSLDIEYDHNVMLQIDNNGDLAKLHTQARFIGLTLRKMCNLRASNYELK